jgi:MoxR-like ATPase
MAPDVLRHRIILSYEAEAEGLSTDDIILQILDRLEVP